MNPSLPASETLLAALKALFGQEVQLLSRQPNVQTSTAPSEFVTCRIRGAKPQRLFCKYAEDGYGAAAGHRGGVAFEAMVYRELLGRLNLPSARFYGSYRVPENGATYLFLQALDENAYVSSAADPRAMVHAARWAGRFHALGISLASALRNRLHCYDLAYYRRWLEQTLRRAVGADAADLVNACERIAPLLPRLLEVPPTIIHGEYYPQNILVDGSAVYPIDWESAAVACGEIDLASLIERWPEPTVRECVEAYCKSRWAGRAPAEFDQTLDIARAYLHLRWMGRLSGPLKPAVFKWRLQHLCELSERLDTKGAPKI